MIHPTGFNRSQSGSQSGASSSFRPDTGTILFTDVSKSTVMWGLNEEEMELALDQHELDVQMLAKQHHGTVIKGIGDAYMLHFEGPKSLIHAIDFATALQQRLEHDTPIHVGSSRFRIRIGIAKGPLLIKPVIIQGKRLYDVFGPTVNTASRMESKVSAVGGFAYTDTERADDVVHAPYIHAPYLKLTENVKSVRYSDQCGKPSQLGRRSSRLILAAHQLYTHDCKDVTELKGVRSVMVYKVDKV